MQSPPRQHICMPAAQRRGPGRMWDCLIAHIYSAELGDQSSLHSSPWCKALQITSLRWSLELTRVIGGSESLKLPWKTWDFHAANAQAFKHRIWPGDLEWCSLNLGRGIRGWSRAVRIIIRVWGSGMFWTSASHRKQPLSEESIMRVLNLEKSHILSRKLLFSHKYEPLCIQYTLPLPYFCLHKGGELNPCTRVLIFISLACRM